jgi:hypothetical protein
MTTPYPVAGQSATAAQASPGAWQLITLINGWVNGSSGNQKIACRYIPLTNEIQIQGTINGASKSSSTFGVIPSGVGIPLPGTQIQFPVGQSGGSAAITPFLQVDTAGNLTINTAAAAVYVIGGRIPVDAPGI